MKNINNLNEGIFDLAKKDKPSTGAITAADAKIEPKTDIKKNDSKKSDFITTLKTHKTNYLKYVEAFIDAFNKTDGEDEERINDKSVVNYKNYLIKLSSTIKKTSEIGVVRLGIKPLGSWWTNLFSMVEKFSGDIDELKKSYNNVVEKSKLGNMKSNEKQEKVKSPVDGWIKLLDNPKELKTVNTAFAKKLLRFTEIFGLNESFINKMIEALDFEDKVDDDDFEEALEFIQLAKSGERDIGQVLKAWKEANPEKYKDKVTNYYNKIKDDGKKIRFEAAVSGKKIEKQNDEKSATKIETGAEKTDEEEYTLRLKPSQFVRGMEKLSKNPERFKIPNKEILGASTGTQAYLDWNDFKKMLDYIQDPEGFEDKVSNRKVGFDAIEKAKKSGDKE